MSCLALTVRLDKEIVSLLRQGRRRTLLTNQELITRTLRLHLADVIETEAKIPLSRLTAISPWPRGALKQAYKRTGKAWDEIEAKAAAAQRRPSSANE